MSQRARWIDEHLYSDDIAAAEDEADTVAVGETVLASFGTGSSFPGIHSAEVLALDIHGVRFKLEQSFGELYVPWKYIESLLIARTEDDAQRIRDLAEKYHGERRRAGR